MGLIINSMAGFAFACFDFPLKKVLYAVILMTFMIPFEAIALPLSVPVTISAALMIFISQWNSYLWPLIIGMSKDMQVIQTALGSFQQERGTLWSCLYAATAISAVIPLVIFLPLQKYYVEGITSSGVKG
ncbi:carbohydrate ABC transporter permease [Lachnospiraceae bacterium]|nr:carbohydrate ABC transporter permease [Lachnospiraceae bacterium]